MDLESLKAKALKYQDTLASISVKRQDWHDSVKVLLINTLKKVQKELGLDWHVQILDEIKNLETINITMNSSHSGLYSETATTKKAYPKEQSALIFSLLYNADVAVNIIYPEIKEWISRKDNKSLGCFKLTEITEEFIYKRVDDFLNELIAWEENNRGGRIGYKP